MISFKKACEIIKKNIKVSKKEELIKIEEACSRIVSRDYYSKFDMPFNNLSAMDGIVVNKRSLSLNKKYRIVGESKSGDTISKKFGTNECKLIFTGAPLPSGNHAIIPKENCTHFIENNCVIINKIPKQNFIRKKGFDIKKNQRFLKSGSIITLRALALAKSLRLEKVRVIKKPRIFIISTGDEIKNKQLIVPTNHLIVEFLTKKFGGEVLGFDIISDDPQKFTRCVKRLKNFDLLITTGGISEGKYDVVKNSLNKINIKILFDKVAIKPGKPTTFGEMGENKHFLGLPGNPVSCFTAMLFFFPIFIKKFYGKEIIKMDYEIFKSANLLKKNGKLTTFQRVKCRKNSFKIFSQQDSSMQNILSKSNWFIIRSAYAKQINKNQNTKILTFKKIVESYI